VAPSLPDIISCRFFAVPFFYKKISGNIENNFLIARIFLDCSPLFFGLTLLGAPPPQRGHPPVATTYQKVSGDAI
jgi:hypothetical protein